MTLLEWDRYYEWVAERQARRQHITELVRETEPGGYWVWDQR